MGPTHDSERPAYEWGSSPTVFVKGVSLSREGPFVRWKRESGGTRDQ